jgi:hypothetical protein
MDSINVPTLILEFKKASPNAQVTALHRLIYSLDDEVVVPVLERCLWKLHNDGIAPAKLHTEVMAKLTLIPNSKFKKH